MRGAWDACILEADTGVAPLAALAPSALQPHPPWAAGARLLLNPLARPDEAWLEVVQELVASHPQAVLLGRAWAMAASGPRLDPPEQPAWLLLPPSLDPPEADGPEALLTGLLESGSLGALPILEASDLAPLHRAGAPAAVGTGRGWRRHPAGARRLTASLAQQPSLALLLLAPASELEELERQLRPLPSLPWQVEAQALEPGQPPIAVLSAALDRCKADWIWPLLPGAGQSLPSPALIAAVAPWLQRVDADGLNLGSAGLVLRRSWWEGWDDPPPEALSPIPTAWLRRGAHLLDLPMRDSTAGNAASPELWTALLAQIDRAEALLLQQRNRIEALERQCAGLQQQLNAAAAAPVPPPDDPTAG